MTPREFAIDVVRALRRAGHEAYWAGGCVRDEQMGRVPKDYDVATSARPEQVRAIFGERRTAAVGACFGVIIVFGPKSAGSIDVATFRRDMSYTDGRRPDAVVFSSAAEDAARRDFTINGLFFDPLENRIIDYVGGMDDLRNRRVRAIGDPHQRIAEDKLRMLRGVRFAAAFQFELEANTAAAIRAHAQEINLVSAERILAELTMMFEGPNRRRALELLRSTGLLAALLPESADVFGPLHESGPTTITWTTTLAIVDHLGDAARPPLVFAALLRPICGASAAERIPVPKVTNRWRMSTHDTQLIAFVLETERLLRSAISRPWPEIQRLLIRPEAEDAVAFAAAVAQAEQHGVDDVAFCLAKLRLPAEQLNPPPWITGNDLKQLGIPVGPVYRRILEKVRDEQLEGHVVSRRQALELARRIHQSETS